MVIGLDTYSCVSLEKPPDQWWPGISNLFPSFSSIISLKAFRSDEIEEFQDLSHD